MRRLKGALLDFFLSERGRRMWRRWHRGGPITFHHRVDDPYSHLLLQPLARLADRTSASIVMNLVPPPDDAVNPEQERSIAHALADASQLANEIGVDFAATAPPDADAVDAANRSLLARPTLERAIEIGHALWSGSALPDNPDGAAPMPDLAARLKAGRDALWAAGHYNSAVLTYEGEHHWGVDRLGYLEARLRQAGLLEGADPLVELSAKPIPVAGGPYALELFYSFRSPYSYLAVERAYAIAAKHQVELRLRPVLPMVMRGLPVPFRKRLYIALDSKREATRLGLPFGNLCDPLGVGVERCIAVLLSPAAEGKQQAFLQSATRGFWSEAMDVATDRDLRTIVERAGLDWPAACTALGDDAWRETAETNRQALLARGLWGVPSFGYGDLSLWGQDRLDRLDATIAAHVGDGD